MKIYKKKIIAEIARRSFPDFAQAIYTNISLNGFHSVYYEVLNAFAKGKIKKLMVSVPPQHGKSLASSQLLPAYILGIRPSSNVALVSYNVSLASRFSRRVQRILSEDIYKIIFPGTRLKDKSNREGYVRTNEEFDIVGTGGRLLAVGREGALTGNAIDVCILDDMYKDAMEANSPLIRENTWAWYNSVVKTRMHNDSQELMVFTRWHEEDLMGRIEANEKVVNILDLKQLENPDHDVWYKLNFEAIKKSPPSGIDPRPTGTALWPERQSVELLEQKKNLDPYVFETMYQGHPLSPGGLLYKQFLTYRELPADIVKRANYTDTADTGEDFLCSVCYVLGMDGMIYVTDVVYSQEGMEVTEEEVAAMLIRNDTSLARIESNNGGRGFARSLSRLVPKVQIEWFYQSKNKEARILSNSSIVARTIIMPENWNLLWPEFHRDIVTYRRIYKANRWHDAADVLTGMIETETTGATKKIKALGFKQ